MKIDTAHGEGTAIVKEQVFATIRMLEVVAGFLENGRIKDAYSACNFDLLQRASSNLEILAEETTGGKS